MAVDIKIDQICEKLHVPQDVYVRILAKSFASTEQDLATLDDAIARTDLDVMQSISHRLKGTYSNLRMIELASAAEKMNNAVKAGAGKEEYEKFLGEFKGYFEEVKSFFQ